MHTDRAVRLIRGSWDLAETTENKYNRLCRSQMHQLLLEEHLHAALFVRKAEHSRDRKADRHAESPPCVSLSPQRQRERKTKTCIRAAAV